MAFQQRDFSGVLFVNDRKQNDNQPDRTGTALIGGVQYRVSGWLKSGARGQFLSLAFTPADQQRQPAQDQGASSGPGTPSKEDDVPFAPNRA